MDFKGIPLDKFQEDAIAAIESNKSVVVSAPTGSGKTLIADYIIDRDIKKGVRVVYTAPIKALSNQKYKDFCAAYGEDSVGLLTGDTVRNSGAKILIMTTEIYRNMVLVDDPVIKDVSYVVFDEIHYINDVERGYVWEESIIFSPPNVRVLCLSATIPNADEFASWIQAIKGHEVVVVRHEVRPVPLHVNFFDTELGVTTLKNLKELAEIDDYHYVRGNRKRKRHSIDAPKHTDLMGEIKDLVPCLFFCFSRGGCEQRAEELSRKKFFEVNNKVSEIIIERLKEAPPEMNRLDSTRLLRQLLPQGIGFHHAGLLPIMKDIVEDLFGKGLLKVLYTTETFAVGINMPAKAVCFESLRKFDGREFRLVNSKEFFQIAGRAGRRGIDKEGFVFIMVARRDFDYAKMSKIIEKDVLPIESQFRLSVNTVLNLIKNHNEVEIESILCKSFHSFQEFGKDFAHRKNYRSHSAFEKCKKILEKKGYLKDGKLTEKGEFTSKIYSDELLIGEIFATPFVEKLDEYQMFLTIAAICYEPREKTQFRKKYTHSAQDLRGLLREDKFLGQDRHFEYLEDVSALVYPCYQGTSIFEIFNNTNLLEGDVIRFFRQVIDRMGQIINATNNRLLQEKLIHVKGKISTCLEQIEVL